MWYSCGGKDYDEENVNQGQGDLSLKELAGTYHLHANFPINARNVIAYEKMVSMTMCLQVYTTKSVVFGGARLLQTYQK